MPAAENESPVLASGEACPLCGQPAGKGVFRLRTREYLRGRRQLLKTEARTGLCAGCDASLAKKRWQATGLVTLPTVIFTLFGFGKITLVLMGVNLVYVIKYGRYTWADHLLYGRELLPLFAAEFEAHGTNADAVDTPDRSMPTGAGHWWLRTLLAFAVPATIAVLWVKLGN